MSKEEFHKEFVNAAVDHGILPDPLDRNIIVAEISVTWPKENIAGGLLANRFEDVIAINQKRGFVLLDWKMSSTMVPTRPPNPQYQLIETIIATFKRRPEAAADNGQKRYEAMERLRVAAGECRGDARCACYDPANGHGMPTAIGTTCWKP